MACERIGRMLSFVAAALVGGSVYGQVLREPKFWWWGSDAVSVPAPWIVTRVIQLNLFDNAQLTGALGQQAGQWVTPQTNPAGAAAALAQRVLASGLPADRVCGEVARRRDL